jgi:alcohol dehydrogenase
VLNVALEKKTMKKTTAAVFNSPGQPLEFRCFPVPELAPGEALVQITTCTLCGSDLHSYQGHRTIPTPTVLGHEIIGKIAALGPGEPICDFYGRPLQIDTRVTWSIAASCGDCFYCRDAIPQKCEHLFKYGHEILSPDHPLSGGVADYCHLAAGTAIFPLPEELPDLVACPANCATATVAAAYRISGGAEWCREKVVLVQGAGMLGLTACAMAHDYGARAVIVSDIDSKRLETALQFGATHCVLVNEDEGNLNSIVEELTSERGVDLALELSGASGAMANGLNQLRIGGRYVLVGAVSPVAPTPVFEEIIIRRILSIHGIHNYTPQDLAEALRFLKDNHNKFPFSTLVKDKFRLDQVEEAFQYAIRSGALRIAILPQT